MLFDFAVEELAPAGWKAEIITYDLHGDDALMEGNVMTEYEEKFSAMGNPICKYIILPDAGNRLQTHPMVWEETQAPSDGAERR